MKQKSVKTSAFSERWEGIEQMKALANTNLYRKGNSVKRLGH